MINKTILVMLFMIELKCSLFKQEDGIKKVEFMIIERSTEYISKINNVFDVKLKEDDLNNGLVIKKIVRPYLIDKLDKDKRDLSIEIMNDYIYRFIKSSNSDHLKSFIYEKECRLAHPVFDPKIKEISKFNIQMMADYIESFNEFFVLFKEWKNKSPHKYIYRRDINTIDTNDAPKLIENVISFKERFNQFNDKFKVISESVREELDKLECGIKDIMTFYDVLPRFHLTYSSIIPNTYIKRLYSQLWVHRTTWTKRIIKFTRRTRFIQLWVSVFDNFIKQAERDSNPSYIVKMQRNLISFDETVVYTSKVFKMVLDRVKEVEKLIYNSIQIMEEHSKMAIIDFPDHSPLYRVMSVRISICLWVFALLSLII